MSYMRASTANPNGWRPGTVRLGEMRRRHAPDWKDVVANQDATQRLYNQQQAAARNRALAGMALVDARARGVSLPAIQRRPLSGLGFNFINSSTPIVQGAQYVFHFTYGGLGLAPDMSGLAQSIAADSNFGNPTVSAESGGVQVLFTFNGQVGPGSTVGSYGAEMQNVINSFSNMGFANSLNFSGAELASAATAPGATNTGSIFSSSPSLPSLPSFSLTNFLAGLGTGGAIALAVGAVILLRD